ncbi:MAG: hypothetical protein ACO3YY_08150 [Phycisphaerales bacterium]|jgi:adenylate cyclase
MGGQSGPRGARFALNPHPLDRGSGEASPPLEIERVFLLRGLPPLPATAEAHRLEQGYLDLEASSARRDPFAEGRLRRWVRPDGEVACFHTVKRGSGVVREEIEREISQAEFAAAWPRTGRRRIEKTRYRVPEGDLVWEVDRFDQVPLVLAEVELPAPDHPVETPAWLDGWIVREISEDPRYRNSELARRIAGGEALPPLA